MISGEDSTLIFVQIMICTCLYLVDRAYKNPIIKLNPLVSLDCKVYANRSKLSFYPTPQTPASLDLEKRLLRGVLYTSLCLAGKQSTKVNRPLAHGLFLFSIQP